MSSWGAANVCAAGCGSAMKALSLSATDCEIADLIAALLQRHALPRPPSRSTFRRNGTHAVLRGKMLASAGSIVGGGGRACVRSTIAFLSRLTPVHLFQPRHGLVHLHRLAWKPACRPPCKDGLGKAKGISMLHVASVPTFAHTCHPSSSVANTILPRAALIRCHTDLQCMFAPAVYARSKKAPRPSWTRR